MKIIIPFLKLGENSDLFFLYLTRKNNDITIHENLMDFEKFLNYEI